ncbi:NAD(P)/FAD-dependent oxidoreductase [Limibacter armeniacum]|uniref:NAD(P)/FAD-dependent oxidoreductase n=1 Tax=Limibacter armeniacum TaxID=466084 RepID=UPI002FE6AE3A
MSKIIILGAGPSGSSCAISLLKAGHEVTIIDRSHFPRNAPGETLHPGIEPLLKELGVSRILENGYFMRHEGIESLKESQSKFIAYNEDEAWKGFQLFRADFDHQLLNEAIGLGAQFIPKCTISKLSTNQGFVESIEVNNTVINVDFIIDATGKRAWLANELGVRFSWKGAQKIAYYGYVKEASFQPENPRIEWDENGWTWIARVKDDLTAWVRLDLDVHRKVDNDWIPTKLKDGKSTGGRKAVDVTWRIAEPCSFANCFLVGDAAFVLDPGASHGVLKAIMSGMMAAHLIEQSKTHSMAKIHEHYNSWMQNQFDHDVTKLRELYEKYEVKTNANNV